MPGFNIGKSLPGCNLQFGNDASNLLPNTIETARSNRYSLIITIPAAFGGEAPFSNRLVSLSCESISRPIVRIEKEQVFNGSDYINVPLRAKYEPVELSLYEIVKPGGGSDEPIDTVNSYNLTAESVFKWWTNGVFDYRRSRVTFPESRRTTVDILLNGGAADSPIWAYRLYRAWPEAIMPANLDYKAGAILRTALTIVYDKYEEINPDEVI